MLRYEEIICFKDGSIIFLYSLKHLGDKKEVQEVRFGEMFSSSKNVPKNIGICPGTLISRFGIIKIQEIL